MTSEDYRMALEQERHDAARHAPACSPDCAQGKHRACSGDAWDEATDDPTDCSCECHLCTCWSPDEARIIGHGRGCELYDEDGAA